jgi:hypothetical protein
VSEEQVYHPMAVGAGRLVEQGLHAHGRQLAQAPATCSRDASGLYGLRMVWDGLESMPAQRGTSVKVCIVDGGVDPTHPEMVKNVFEGATFLDAKYLLQRFGIKETTPWNDPGACDHGMHVTGTIASSTCVEGPATWVPHVPGRGRGGEEGSATQCG